MVSRSRRRRTASGRPSSGTALWLRWSWRDLRRHWVAVVAIALVLAIGSGVWAGLGSTSTWRRQTNDASFAAVHMHDLRATLSPGTFVDEATLASAAAPGSSTPSRSTARSSDWWSTPRSTPPPRPRRSWSPGRIVGMPFDADAARRQRLDPGRRRPRSGDGSAGRARSEVRRLLLAAGHRLGDGRRWREIGYVGLGVAPEDFYVTGPEGTIFAQGELAILYLPLAAGPGARRSARAGQRPGAHPDSPAPTATWSSRS